MKINFYLKNFPIILVSFLYYILVFFLPFRTVIHIGILSFTVFLFYILKKDLFTALVFTLILTLPNELGFFGSITRFSLMEPVELELGQGIVITSTSLLLVPVLLAFVFRKSKRYFQYSVQIPDILIFLFFSISIFSSFFVPNGNGIFGITSLSEIILLYFILRIFIRSIDASDISKIVIVSLLFQVLIGLLQEILRRNIGVPTESVIASFPYGATAPENENIFRISGLFGHPNYFDGFLLAFFPFLFIRFRITILRVVSIFMTFAAIIFTQGRAAWVLSAGFLTFFALNFRTKITIFLRNQKKRNVIFLIGVGICTIAFLLPSILLRLTTVSDAFEENGSVSIRLKLYQEAIGLMTTYPMTGVGLNRSLEYYAYQPITNIFDTISPSSFYKIHDLFLEIGSEIGIPALFSFCLFIASIFYQIYAQRRPDKKSGLRDIHLAAVSGLVLWLCIAALNPFFHTFQLKFFVLLCSLCMIDKPKVEMNINKDSSTK